jgi:hypothetical protein
MKQSKVLVPLAIPLPIPVIAYAMKSTSETHTTGITLRTAPLATTHAVNMLVTLEKAVGNLPDLYSISMDHPNITIISDGDNQPSET